jgi:hypothetical protein
MQATNHDRPSIGVVWTLLLTTFALAAAAQSVDEELPLPRWEKDPPVMKSDAGNHFNSLLPADQLLPALPEPQSMLQSGPRLGDAPPSVMPGYGDVGPMDLSLFLHGSILQAQKNPQSTHSPTPVLALRDLSQDITRALLDAPSNDLLIDPQNLVPEVTRGDVERLLTFHAGESTIRIYLLVIDANQKLPDSFDLALLAHGALKRQASCLAVYPLGEPWRARLLLSQSVHSAGTSASLADMAADCIRDAQQAEEEGAQLQRYAVRLSTRLFWLQKLLINTPVKAASNAPRLLEVVGQDASPAPAAVAIDIRLWLALAATAVSLLALIAILLLKRPPTSRRSTPTSHTWILPEPEATPRLGGAFSGGAGAVASFKS